MATSINGYTFLATPNSEGTLITIIAHKDDATGGKTEVFKFSTAEANDFCDMLKHNCKLAKDRHKAGKKGKREEEPCRDKSPDATTAGTTTVAHVPSKSVESSASTPKKKDVSSSKKSGTGVPPVAPKKTDAGVPPRSTETSARQPWSVDPNDFRVFRHGPDNWRCEVFTEDITSADVEQMVQKIVQALNNPTSIAPGGRYELVSPRQFTDTDVDAGYQLLYTAEHVELPSLYTLVGMLNTYHEQQVKNFVEGE